MGYSKQGFNYGIGQQPTAQTEADMASLKQKTPATKYIRGTYPSFDVQDMAAWQEQWLIEKSKFFVMAGITCPTNKTKYWYNFLQKWVDLSGWAAANGIVWGFNEEMYHGDESVIPNSLKLKDMHQAAKIARTLHPTLKPIISLAGDGELDFFINQSGVGDAGRGAFEFIALNQYGSLSDFKRNVDKLTAVYGDKTRLTEYSTDRGYDPAYGNEASWKADVKARADYAEDSILNAHCIYTLTNNPELTASGTNKWNMRTSMPPSPETYHQAFDLFR